MSQPTPQVNRDDVLRIIQRDFSPAQHAEVLAILEEYGTIDWQRARDRVQLAVLKLAKGDLDRVRNHTQTACGDYRDVLAPAEYAAYLKLGPKELANEAQKAKAVEDDLKEYQQWLARE